VKFAASARRLIGSLPLAGAVAISVMGLGGVATLLAYDNQHPDTAYAAISEVEDSPIEDLSENRPGTIRRASDGLFYARLTANGRSLRCIVDTGASAMVLSATDSHRIGLNPATRYNGRIHTAGGERQAARSHIEDITLAGHSFRNVPAIVVRGMPTPCLLGQNLLTRLDGAEFHGNTLILR